MEVVTYTGSCHCGGIRFRVVVREHRALDCNCSVCRRKGFLHLIVEKADLQLVEGESLLTTYTFNTGVAQHHFCRRCGMHPFYTPRSHPDGVDVNLRCLDGFLVDGVARLLDEREWKTLWERFTVVPFDGANWEATVETIR
jgi:hypothetical protein